VCIMVPVCQARPQRRRAANSQEYKAGARGAASPATEPSEPLNAAAQILSAP
jgi:hypothetical protein